MTALYDASVLYPSMIRNLLMHLAVTPLVYARWTTEIQHEWTTNLRQHRPDLTAKQLQRTQQHMLQAVPDALVSRYAHLIPTLTLPDPDDRHVLAAAIKTGAHCIVTSNIRHFPPAQLHGILALPPDDFVTQLWQADPTTSRAALEYLRSSLKNPAYEPGAFRERLEQVGLVRLAAVMS